MLREFSFRILNDMLNPFDFYPGPVRPLPHHSEILGEFHLACRLRYSKYSCEQKR